jgi:hypothetical protein
VNPGPSVAIVDFGEGAARLLAEYDVQGDAIRVNARAVARVRAVLGAQEAERFVRYAVAHESCHRANRRASEEEAHAFARQTCGVDAAAYERALRR